MVIEIEINDELKKEALNHASERINFEYDRFKLDLKQRKDMILIGTIGQLIFKKYLELNKIPFSFEFQAGKYDNLDFEINSKILEIKTSGFVIDWNNLNLLYSNSQFKRGIKKKYAYCIQIFINGYDKENKRLKLEECNKAFIIGGIEFPKIKEFKTERKSYGDDYKIPLKTLIPIQEVIKQCEK